MTVKFQYCREKDIWCLLNKGRSSNNSQNPTKEYEQLMVEYGDNPSPDSVAFFIEKFLSNNEVDVQQYITSYQNDWDEVVGEYQKRAEVIFGVSLPDNLISYLTINSRCPYSIEDNYFFVSFPSQSPRRTVMHELWHFYTWYGLGIDQEQKLGKQKYNDLKEALTVLLNVECKDLMPEGVYDSGYPQHKELREKIVELWKNEKNISKLWEEMSLSL